MYFELWDTETRNLLYDFDTLDDALVAARELCALNRDHYPAHLALARVEVGRVTSWLGRGETLTPLLADQSDPPAHHTR